MSVLGFNSSEGITDFTNYDISDSNMRCDVCIKELWDDMSRKVDLLKNIKFTCEGLKQKLQSYHTSILMSILSIAVEILEFLKNMLTKT